MGDRRPGPEVGGVSELAEDAEALLQRRRPVHIRPVGRGPADDCTTGGHPRGRLDSQSTPPPPATASPQRLAHPHHSRGVPCGIVGLGEGAGVRQGRSETNDSQAHQPSGIARGLALTTGRKGERLTLRTFWKTVCRTEQILMGVSNFN